MKSNDGQQMIKEEPRFGLKVIETKIDFYHCSIYGSHPLGYRPPEGSEYVIPVRMFTESEHSFDLFIRYLLFWDHDELLKLLNYQTGGFGNKKRSLLLMKTKERLVHLRGYLNTPLLIVDGISMENTDYPEILVRIDHLLKILDGYSPGSESIQRKRFSVKENNQEALFRILQPMVNQAHQNSLLEFISNKRNSSSRIEFVANGTLIYSLFWHLINAEGIESTFPVAKKILSNTFCFSRKIKQSTIDHIFLPGGGQKRLSKEDLEKQILKYFDDHDEALAMLDHLDVR